jgi:hypothetical protein
MKTSIQLQNATLRAEINLSGAELTFFGAKTGKMCFGRNKLLIGTV